MSDGGTVCYDAFLRASFDFDEGRGRCAVAAKHSELFSIAEVFEDIVCRYRVRGMD